MRTTTVVFQFDPEPLQTLSTKVANFRDVDKPPLINFCNTQGISSDNLVSEDVDYDACLRTVVRSWPDLATATGWLEVINTTPRISEYPGIVISTQVDPE